MEALGEKDDHCMSDTNAPDADVNNSVTPLVKPRPDWCLEHLQFLFGRALTGRIEITSIKVGDRPLPKTKFFDLDDMEAAVDYAMALNSEPGRNVYVGAATRHEDVFPGKAADDTDFERSYCLFADFDDDHDFEAARKIYEAQGLKPALVVVTGRHPTKRVQVWWPLEEAISDRDEQRSSLRGIVAALHSDPVVCSAKQIMRLAGGLNWPKKEGRILEVCELHRPKNALQAIALPHIHKAFPPVSVADFKTSGIVDVEIAPSGSLGLIEKVMDHREGYAFRLVRAHLVEIIGTTGSEPTPDELYQSVAPVFFAKADQIRPGRGPTFLKQKCVEAVSAFERGMIPFARTLDEAVETYAAKIRGEIKSGDPFDQIAAFEATDESVVKSRSFPASQLNGEPPTRQWIVQDWIIEGAVNSLYGDGGVGKTLLAQQLGASVSLGVHWIGLETKKGSVMAILCEDEKDELWRRHNDIKAALGYAIGNPFDDFHLWPRVGESNLIVTWDRDGTAKLSAFYEDLVAEIRDKQPSLLILDTLADIYGGNEIDRVQVNYFIKTVLGGLIRERGPEAPLTVLLLGHPSVSGKADGRGFSGSTAWNNSVRSRMYLQKPDDGASEERILTRGKANYAASGDDTAVRLFYANGVLHAGDDVPGTDSLLWACIRDACQAVNKAWDEGNPYTGRKSHSRHIYAALPTKLLSSGYAPNLVRQAVREAVDDEKIYLAKSNGKSGYRALS